METRKFYPNAKDYNSFKVECPGAEDISTVSETNEVPALKQLMWWETFLQIVKSEMKNKISTANNIVIT